MTKKEQRIRKIKRTRFWGGFAVLLVVTVIECVILYLAFEIGLEMVLKENYVNEYERIGTIANCYQNGISDEDMERILGEEKRIYFVKNQKGELLHSTGKDTMAEEQAQIILDAFVEIDEEAVNEIKNAKGKVLLETEIKENEEDDTGLDLEMNVDEELYNVQTVYMRIHVDKEVPVFKYQHDGVEIDFPALVKWISDTRFFEDEEYYKGNKLLELPFWIERDLEDGSILYGKGFYRVRYADMAMMVGLMGVIGVLLVFTFLILIFSMISVIRRQRKATAVFFMDEVTGGKNWLWFLLKVGQFLRRRRNDKYNFAIVDLVFVNYRNFCMCHSVAEGEELLTKLDIQIRHLLNKRKEACAHYASDHFALLLYYQSEEELKARLEDLMAKLEQVDAEHNFSFHLGVNMLPARLENGRTVRRKRIDIDEQYNNASTACMTLTDTEGSAIAYFDAKLIEEQKWLDQVQEAQKGALENEEFVVYYQPKCNPVTGKLTGAEALIRWNSSKYGFLSPGRFIPIFEKNGFITEIDHYMITHVARDQKRWMDAGMNCVPVSVNVSRAHFIEHDLAEQIRNMVDAEGAPHNLIELELTESAFFDDKKAIIHTIGKLKEYGFTVSMDDFGSGYSSLNSLKDMPLDVLKLDAEFFRGENAGERGEIVVKEAIRLAKALHMKTVAEGIEAREQVSFLADQGCDMIQGYVFAHPMPGNDYEDAMKKGVQSIDKKE